ncbi:MAG: glycosyltransferase [Rhodopila sp.]
MSLRQLETICPPAVTLATPPQVRPEPTPTLSVAIYMHDLSPGGVERQCLVLAHALKAHGAKVTLVLHERKGELEPLLPDGLTVVDLRGSRTLHDIGRLRRFLLERQPDILMANVDYNNVAASLATIMAGTRTRLVICQHNPLTPTYYAVVSWKYRFIPLLYRLLAFRIDRAVAVSDGIAAELVSRAGVPPRKIVTISNAVIGDDFNARAGMQALHPWFRSGAPPVFVSAGRLVEMKDHRLLIQGFAQFRKNRPGRLMILGLGPLREELEQLAVTLGVADDVAFLGFVQNPLPYMRQAAAFVLCSRAEGFGNVLVEAMGCGTPVISTDCPHGPAEILSNGRYGILVRQRDPAVLAKAMAQILDRRALWPATLLKARAAAFSVAACAENYWQLFQELAGPAPEHSAE